MKKDELAWWLAEKLEPEPDCSPPIPAKQLDWNYEWASKLGFWTYWGGLDKNGEPMRRSVAPLDGNFATAVMDYMNPGWDLRHSSNRHEEHVVCFLKPTSEFENEFEAAHAVFAIAVCLAAKAALESLDED